MTIKLKNQDASLQAIQNAVQQDLYYNLSNIRIESYNNIDDIKQSIAKAVAEAVAQGFHKFLEEQYTNEDFERDMGLRE